MDFPGDRLQRQRGLTTEPDRHVEAPPPFSEDDLLASIPARFEAAVAACSARLAVKSRHHAWTYFELNRTANCIAHAVLGAAGTACAPVALLFEHDAPAIAAMLGVMKAGKFYAALDPSFPLLRNKAVLADLAAPVLLCDRANLPAAASLATSGCRLLVYEDLDDALAQEDPVPTLTAESPFGVFYTSGSTGQPKGVQWRHKLPLHRVLVDIADAGIAPQDRHTLLTSFSFAAAASDMCLPLLNGASLHLYDVQKLGPAGFAEWLRQEGITLIRSPIALFRHFVRSLGEREIFPSVRVVGLSGSALFRDDVERARPHFSSACRVIHRYTISEGGMIARLVIDPDTHLDTPVVPAGYAVPGKHVLVVDENRCEVAPDIAGEVAVRSRYLPGGYWRHAEQNLMRFIPDEADAASVLCLTGDRGTLRADGRLELLGRGDSRVKIRGYRVELAAVEGALREAENVKDAVVVTQPDAAGEMSLIGYVVPAREPAPAAGALRRQLAATLPDYMLPSAFVFLDAMPLTPNGKIDRKALLRRGQSELAWACQGPRNATEAALIAIWSDVLKRDPLGVEDNFFESGGHSLAAARVVARIHQMLHVSLPLRSIYDAPTVAGLAKMIEQAGAAEGQSHGSGNEEQAVQEAMRRLGLD